MKHETLCGILTFQTSFHGHFVVIPLLCSFQIGKSGPKVVPGKAFRFVSERDPQSSNCFPHRASKGWIQIVMYLVRGKSRLSLRGRAVVLCTTTWKDTSGELILVVVGTEGSSRNMLYVVSEDYLDAFGHTSTINSDTKWRTRKGVVEWLTFLISKHHQSPPISSMYSHVAV
ncbi:hypothetical protein MTR67_047242 [Solanum verrucosum]|uniref:Uncharacterized protein n=1 Tax=Solanum verrucosum TaxID=315347 RepID=A0AAF0UWC4_SOLVR|nr:hypothetical protein MTR67_047242 [Solanum verrucosum]